MSSRNSQNEPFYISLEVVLEIHQRQLKEFGGADGTLWGDDRDRGKENDERAACPVVWTSDGWCLAISAIKMPLDPQKEPNLGTFEIHMEESYFQADASS